MSPFGNEKSAADRTSEIWDDAVALAAEQWLYFSKVLVFKDEVGLRERICAFTMPMFEGLRSNFPPLAEASDELLFLLIAKAVEKSGSHSSSEIERALGVPLPGERAPALPDASAAEAQLQLPETDASLAKTLLQLPDEGLAAVVKEMMERQPPDAHAMTVVAYKNLAPMLSIFNNESEKLGQSLDITDMLKFAAEFRSPVVRAEDKGEVIQRRSAWFLAAITIHRLTEKAETNPTLLSTAADIWVTMAKSGKYLKALLLHNIIWRADEKEWFSHIKDEVDGINYVANHVVPKGYRKDARLVALAKEHNFWLDPPELTDAGLRALGIPLPD